jgi:hypothetical protein
VHLDVAVSERQWDVDRLRALGATVAARYTVMRDPEGNQFCLVAAD